MRCRACGEEAVAAGDEYCFSCAYVCRPVEPLYGSDSRFDEQLRAVARRYVPHTAEELRRVDPVNLARSLFLTEAAARRLLDDMISELERS